MEASAASRHSKRKKKDKKHRRSKSKSKRKHRKRSSSSSEESPDIVNHQEAVHLVKKTLDSLLSSDPILNDLANGVTLEEVESLIALEHGQAIHIEIHRADSTTLPIIIHQNATVGKLKRAVERATELKLSRDHHRRRRRRISWKYVWKTYWLYAHGVKLKDDSATLKDCAISNNDRVSFIKRLEEK